MQDSQSSPDLTEQEGLWKQGLSFLQTELDPQIFAAYIKPLKPAAYDSVTSELLVKAPSRLVCKHLNKHFKNRIEEIFSNKIGLSDLNIRFAVDCDVAVDSIREAKAAMPYVVVKKNVTADTRSGDAADKFNGRQNLDPKYTFCNFVVGSSNQFCHAAAMQVAESPGKNYNPLFIYSGVGLGKTHLLHAIGNAVLARNPYTKVLYMSSEAFTNELIQSLRLGKMDQFKNRLRSIEVLMIDDIQFMCGKERTQEEFFHTFNALYSAKNQIIITSDKIPQEIPGLEERLRTRFSWGLIADLQVPDFETRVAILKRKASLENFTVPDKVAGLIAQRINSNVRELEGALTRLHAVSSLQNVPISEDLALTCLRDLLEPKVVNITVDDIKKTVATHFNIKVSDMVSKRRTRNLSFPRHVAMYLCRKHTPASYPEIGYKFGGRDHSSVIHAANVVASKVQSNPEVREAVAAIEKALFGAR